MQRNTICFLLLVASILSSNLSKAQYTFRSGLNLTALSIDGSNQSTLFGKCYSLGRDIGTYWHTGLRLGNTFFNPQISYTSFSRNSANKLDLKEVYSINILFGYQVERNMRSCTNRKFPKKITFSFRRFFKMGFSTQLQRFDEIGNNRLAVMPCLAVGGAFIHWKGFRLETEISALPNIYSTKINSQRIKTISTNISLGIFIPFYRFI